MRRAGRVPWTAWPMMAWFGAFFAAPVLIVLTYSFLTKGTYGGVALPLTWGNYTRSIDWLYLRIFWNSVELAGLTTLSCLAIGFPTAWCMAVAAPPWRSILVLCVVVPFWTNFVVRAYAIKVLLGEHGPVNEVALRFGLWAEPLVFANSPVAVWFGMVTNYLPFMVLPLYVALEKFDPVLLEAARDLGASPWRAVARVLVPVVKPGIFTGSLLVFTPALGEFVIPDMLGGARTMLIGNLITEQFLKTRDWPFGAALSALLISVVMATLLLYLQTARRSEPGART